MKYDKSDYTQENILKVAKDYMCALNQEMADNDYTLLATIEYKGIITGIAFVLGLFKDKNSFDTAVDYWNSNPPISPLF